MYLNSIYVKKASCTNPIYTHQSIKAKRRESIITSIKGIIVHLLSLLLQFLDEIDKEKKFQTNVVDCDPYGRPSGELGEIMLTLDSTSLAPEVGIQHPFPQ